MSNFIIDSEGFTNVFVDGCWLNSGTTQSAAGYGIYWGVNNRNNESGQSRQGATNNVAEIQGATVAIQKAARLGIKELRVNTDSELVYKAVTENIPKNRTDFEELDRVIRKNSQMTIKFKLLRGHSGNQDHNKADRLAAVGARLHY